MELNKSYLVAQIFQSWGCCMHSFQYFKIGIYGLKDDLVKPETEVTLKADAGTYIRK